MDTLAREHRWDRAGEGLTGESVFPDLPAGSATRAIAEHVERFLTLARRRRREPGAPSTLPEDVYLIDSDASSVREIIGFRLRGHPLAILAAVRFPRHARAPGPHGRPALAYFFSRPPAQIRAGETQPPQGVVELHLPRVDETVTEMVERIRNGPDEAGVQVDVTLIDYVFDLRFANPSEIPLQGFRPDVPLRRLFRTVHGHVLSGMSVGFYKTIRKDLTFITLTDAMQHRPGGENMLPTLAINRRILAMEAEAGDGGRAPAERTLAFHPSTANPTNLLGWAYDAVHRPAPPPPI